MLLSGANGVIPLGTDGMRVDVEGVHDLIGHFDASRIIGGDEMGLDGETGSGGGLPKGVEHHLKRA